MELVEGFTHLILDTNQWIYLAKGETPEVFDELVKSVDLGKTKIVLPDTVLHEWKKHEDATRSEIERAIIDQAKNTELIIDSIPSSERGALKALVSKYRAEKVVLAKERFDKVKNFIETKCELVTPSQTVKDLVIQQALDKGAPFGKNQGKNSVGDALIIFTAIEHLKAIGVYGFDNSVFVSFNHTDFSQDNDHKDVIHPTLAPYLESVKMRYERSFYKAIKLSGDLLTAAEQRFRDYYDEYLEYMIDMHIQDQIDIMRGK